LITEETPNDDDTGLPRAVVGDDLRYAGRARGESVPGTATEMDDVAD
jgi:hypothetical protein